MKAAVFLLAFGLFMCIDTKTYLHTHRLIYKYNMKQKKIISIQVLSLIHLLKSDQMSKPRNCFLESLFDRAKNVSTCSCI